MGKATHGHLRAERNIDQPPDTLLVTSACPGQCTAACQSNNPCGTIGSARPKATLNNSKALVGEEHSFVSESAYLHQISQQHKAHALMSTRFGERASGACHASATRTSTKLCLVINGNSPCCLLVCEICTKCHPESRHPQDRTRVHAQHRPCNSKPPKARYASSARLSKTTRGLWICKNRGIPQTATNWDGVPLNSR